MKQLVKTTLKSEEEKSVCAERRLLIYILTESQK